MSTLLPTFVYHPDPIGTGAIEPREVVCICCGRQRDFVYVGPVYGETDLMEPLCPWCIADGSAAQKLGLSFADEHSLIQAGVLKIVAEEINLRTPAFTSWQAEEWISHCEDACAFMGDASAEDVANAGPETKLAWQERYGLNESHWQELTANYVPCGDPAFYKFQCLHCKAVLLGWDCS